MIGVCKVCGYGYFIKGYCEKHKKSVSKKQYL